MKRDRKSPEGENLTSFDFDHSYHLIIVGVSEW